MSQPSGSRKPATSAEIVEVPDSPPRTKMDLVEADTPDKATLKDEVFALREQLKFLSSHAHNVHASQREGFLRTAKEFETHARDVTTAEVAQNTAEMESNFQSRMMTVEKNIATEMNVVLETQQQSVQLQAEAYIETQRDTMRQIQQEEVSAYRTRVLGLEQEASAQYMTLHQEATAAVTQNQAERDRLWVELQEARHIIQNQQSTSQEAQQGNSYLMQENASLRNKINEQTTTMKAFEEKIQDVLNRQAKEEKDHLKEKHELSKQLKMMQNFMQDLQLKNQQLEKSNRQEQDDGQETEEEGDASSEEEAATSPKETPKPSQDASPQPKMDPPKSSEVPPQGQSESNTTPANRRAQPQGPQAKEADTIHFPKLPHAGNVRYWKMTVRRNVASASGQPQQAFAWLSKAENATSIEELEDDVARAQNPEEKHEKHGHRQ